ncbi:3-oxoacyl-[acyl-carrier-protein] synthase II [Pullulanibacillus pueri]|uniref:3-oxoacyl-[acyl-carrier-protein] synthase 2 n=1 Tax=Pullulanibacillus pueri TaxID=1437324 RepID=A0A8J3ELL8_9BACL|nr:beta-ketoacyl-[acyl-carrier-protein] synthase family protein [Pullulanibacillus pueri]MBM7681063.1 3-oxoacyl-[acyl-carrier-protein] synthase II [Pullulanibacillus pueri]GGH76901.1 3-oxoacyl-[acyl-carrier-protein] synthase 2 [Pullulanibacillus pueri]
MTDRERIVVTGLGAVTPFGVGTSRFWEGIVSGESAVKKTDDEQLRQWAPVIATYQDFDPSRYLSKKAIQGSDRFTQMGIIAAIEALNDAGLGDISYLHEVYQSHRVGISIGCAFGGVQTLEEGSERIYTGRSKRVSARLVPKAIPNAAGAGIAIQYDLHGPVMTYSTACASSANSIGEASYWLRLGKADMVIAGGAECLFSPTILSGLRAAGALAVDGPDQDYKKWSRPFDTKRSGMVMGEGAAMVILETLENAKARNATIYAELVGYGTSNDAYHETSPDPSGKSARLAMEEALESGQLKPEDIDYINAHATATPAGDRAESHALYELFGDHLNKIPVSSIKGAVGHMLGTAGAIESIACIKAIKTSTLPPTINVDEQEDGTPADIVPNHSRNQSITYALSNSFGFGGQNGVLIWKKY